MTKCPRCHYAVSGDGDTYHTIDELYSFRSLQFILLCNLLSQGQSGYRVIKTRRDSQNATIDPDWFLVVLEFPDGRQISQHLHMTYWGNCLYPELVYNFRYDGHHTADVLERLYELVTTIHP